MKIQIAALALLIVCCACSISKNNAAALSDLQERIARLEPGIRNAEAVRAVKRLQHAYGHYSEMGLWHDFADLFAENGVGHYPHGNLGKEGIRKLFLEEVGQGKLGLEDGRLYVHLMLQPVITLVPDGDTARGRWRILAMMGSYGESAVWAGGVYENLYIRENGVWKIRDLRYHSQYRGLYEQPGWTVDNEDTPIHYTPAGAGNPIPDGPAIPPPAGSPPSLSELSERIGALAQRARRLNDEDAVTNLQNIYGYYLDRKMWDDVSDLFADEGTMHWGQRGVYAGKKSIRKALRQFGPQGLRRGELNDRLQIQLIISVAADGQTARARGVELSMSGSPGETGQLGQDIFENEYIRENGVWKILSLHVYPRMSTDYDKGWARDAKPAPGPSPEFPPDRLPADAYRSFPDFQIPPFHFPNPATGHAPRYPEGTAITGNTKFPASGKASTDMPDATTIDELAGRIAETERLLKISIAYSATENLASAYGYYLDEFLWDETADLFARDARRDLSSIGVEIGRENIRKSLKNRYPGRKSKDFFTAHQLIQPVIHVAPDGRSAKMRVRLFQLGGASGKSGFWLAGIYETKTVVEDGVWKFQTMDLDYTWTADYRAGWTLIEDSSKGIIETPFPEIMDLPFHYLNPVTKREPSLFVP